MLTLTKEKKFSLRRIFGKKDTKQQKLHTEYEKDRLDVLISEIEARIPQKETLTCPEVRQILQMGRSGIWELCKRKVFDYRDENGNIVVGVFKLHELKWLIKRQGLIEFLKRINS